MLSNVVVAALLIPANSHAPESTSNQIIYLDGNNWDLRNHNSSIAIKNVTVPSSVPDQLYQHGVLFQTDPRYGWTADAVLDLMTSDNFTYGLDFSIPSTSEDQVIEIVFEGIDTAASVSLDGILIDVVNNMHMKYTFDITAILKHNKKRIRRLEIAIESATRL